VFVLVLQLLLALSGFGWSCHQDRGVGITHSMPASQPASPLVIQGYFHLALDRHSLTHSHAHTRTYTLYHYSSKQSSVHPSKHFQLQYLSFALLSSHPSIQDPPPTPQTVPFIFKQ